MFAQQSQRGFIVEIKDTVRGDRVYLRKYRVVFITQHVTNIETKQRAEQANAVKGIERGKRHRKRYQHEWRYNCGTWDREIQEKEVELSER